MFYKNIKSLTYYSSCLSLSSYEWKKLMTGHKRANKEQVNKLLRKHCPEFYNHLELDFYNPYNYYKTDTHLIIVHSNIEYFFKIERSYVDY